jgi:hypothetical protein
MLMKNFNDIIGNRTRDLLACSGVPQPTAPPRAPRQMEYILNFTLLMYLLENLTVPQLGHNNFTFSAIHVIHFCG